MTNIVNRIGIRKQMNCGEYCEIIAQYKGSKVDVLFDDGNIVRDKFYGNFKNGQISNTKDHIGETNMMNCGLKATIKEYINYHNITVEFEDAYVSKNKGYDCFLNGGIAHNKVKFKKQVDYSNRVGLIKKMNCGMDCKIINYEKGGKVIVEFSDGTILKNRKFSEFKKGIIKNRNIRNVMSERLGEETYNKDGLLLKITRYGDTKDVDVIMNNEKIFYNKSYASFKSGTIGNKLNSKDSDYFIGLKNTNKYGEVFKVVKYSNYKDMLIEFENGHKAKASTSSFREGRCTSPYAKTKRGIGYIGEGKYSSKYTKMYGTWDGMFTRCYGEEYQKQKPTYLNCKISEEWHNFQNFGKWYEENFYECGDELMCLDKDIVSKGNKIYSSDNCIFVPQNINSLFTKCDGSRGDLPIGMTKRRNKYIVRISNYISEGKRIEYGSFDTIEGAFNCYKLNKEKIIKQVADEYKSKYPNFPQKLYDAMYSYEVEITD